MCFSTSTMRTAHSKVKIVLCLSLLCSLALSLFTNNYTHFPRIPFHIKEIDKSEPLRWICFGQEVPFQFLVQCKDAWLFTSSFHQTPPLNDNIASIRLIIFRSKQNLSIQIDFRKRFRFSGFGFRFQWIFSISLPINRVEISVFQVTNSKVSVILYWLVVQIGGVRNAHVQLHTKLYARITVSQLLFKSTQMVYQTLVRFTQMDAHKLTLTPNHTLTGSLLNSFLFSSIAVLTFYSNSIFEA